MRTGITTRLVTTTDWGLIHLLTWLSPSFPTGSYAYSHALEQVVETGHLHDEAGLLAWLGDILTHGTGFSDAVLVRHAYRAADLDAAFAVAELAAAAAPTRERQQETMSQGSAFVRAAAIWPCPMLDALAARLGAERIAYPVAAGVLAASRSIDEDAICVGVLHAFTANLVSAAIRLVPLGQMAGLRVLAALKPTVVGVAGISRTASLDDIGGACFRADIASMRHETQYTRLFRT